MSENKALFVTYEMFGAKGDGVTNDMEAIRAAHNYANENKIDVKTDPFATYYLGPQPMNVPIMTNVDFSTSKFIIDDREVKIEERAVPLFKVVSEFSPIKIECVKSIKKNQMKLDLDIELPRNCYCKVDNANKKQFIRFGLNQNNGSAQTDCFVLDKTGYILNKVIWDFEDVTSFYAYPIDETILTVKGGLFTQIANQAESKYNYHARNIVVNRSNTVIDGITHFVEGEGDHGAPYASFIGVSNCAYVTVQNCHLTPRKIYQTIGSAGKPVSMGSYAFSAGSAVNVTLKNVKQNGIMDRTRWGLMGTNHCKDLYIEDCVMSRFDAHENVANLTIKNTLLGHQCFNAIGCGVMTVENVIAYGNSFLNLRSDYGSNWNGDIIFKNNTWYPNANVKAPCFIGASNAGDHDFGFDCYQTRKIVVDKLYICDGDACEGYTGASLYSITSTNNSGAVDYNDKSVAYPYVSPEKIYLTDIKTESGKGFKVFSADTKNCFAEKKHICSGDSTVPNMRVYLDDVEMPDDPVVPVTALSAEDYGNNHHVVPYIEAKNCENVVIGKTNTPAVIKLEDCTVKSCEADSNTKVSGI